MKTNLLFFTFILFCFAVVAQPPQAINYQGVARDSMGHPLVNKNISLQLSILDSSATGNSIYVETHSTLTSGSGLFNIYIGNGNVTVGNFSSIPWGEGSKWLKVEMDVNGGSSFQLIGVTQFLSVPYALNAGNGNWTKTGNHIYNSNSGNVGVGTTSPDLSAEFEVRSNSKGFLPPRLTFSERNTINNPAAGLLIWCNDCGILGELQIFNGVFWSNMMGGNSTPDFVIGESFQGGIIAYLLQSGDSGYDINITHGLIAAPFDQSLGIQWFNGNYNNTTGATGAAIGTGNSNTNTIVNNQGPGNYAAQLCSDLSLNGYTDWYLPSRDELYQLNFNRIAIGGFVADYYWSSTENGGGAPWLQCMCVGSTGYGQFANPAGIVHVRAIRSF